MRLRRVVRRVLDHRWPEEDRELVGGVTFMLWMVDVVLALAAFVSWCGRVEW